jgi:hypothetical protein
MLAFFTRYYQTFGRAACVAIVGACASRADRSAQSGGPTRNHQTFELVRLTTKRDALTYSGRLFFHEEAT